MLFVAELIMTRWGL